MSARRPLAASLVLLGIVALAGSEADGRRRRRAPRAPGRIAFHVACDAAGCGHTGRPRAFVRSCRTRRVKARLEGEALTLAAGTTVDLASPSLPPGTWCRLAFLDVDDDGRVGPGDVVPPGGWELTVVQAGEEAYVPVVLTLVKGG